MLKLDSTNHFIKYLAKINKLQITAIASIIGLVGVLLIYLSTKSDFQPYSEFFLRLGTILIPSALVSLIYNHILRNTFLDQMRAEIKVANLEAFQVLSDLENAGLRRVYEKFPLDIVLEGVSKAKKNLCIFSTCFPSYELLEETISIAFRNGCRVKILLLCPNSDLAKYRGKDLDPKDLSNKNFCVKIINDIKKLKNDYGISNSVEIRLYNTIPTIVFFAYDDTIIFSPYFKKPGLQGPQFEVKKGNAKSFMFNELEDHFNKVWEDKDTIPLNDCLNRLGEKCYEKCHTQTFSCLNNNIEE